MFNGHVIFYQLVNQSAHEKLLEVFCLFVPHSFSETSALFTFTGIPLRSVCVIMCGLPWHCKALSLIKSSPLGAIYKADYNDSFSKKISKT